MKSKLKGWIGCIIAFIIGIIPAFFIVFNSIFSDDGLAFERFITFLLVIGAFGILGLLFGSIWNNIPWKIGMWLSLPTVIIVALYSIKETGRLPLHLFYLALTVASACLGTRLGSWIVVNRRIKKLISRRK